MHAALVFLLDLDLRGVTAWQLLLEPGLRQWGLAASVDTCGGRVGLELIGFVE